MSTTALFTLEAYEHMATLGAFDGKFHRRVELIRGEIVDMSPIGSYHANVVTLLSEWSFRNAPLDSVMVRVQSPIRLPAIDSGPEPDIVWTVRRNYSAHHPEPGDIVFLIEVAESSLEFDRGRKLAVYAEAGIIEYWVVNLLDEQIEVYRQPRGCDYDSQVMYRGAEEMSPASHPGAVLRPMDLFAQ